MGILPANSDVERYIRQAATIRGIDPDVAVKVWSHEGRGARDYQSGIVKNGVREPSYGPYQLYTGGGLGNVFAKETGLNPADPSTWRQNVDFALNKVVEGGWAPWYGAKNAGILGRAGIWPDARSVPLGTAPTPASLEAGYASARTGAEMPSGSYPGLGGSYLDAPMTPTGMAPDTPAGPGLLAQAGDALRVAGLLGGPQQAVKPMELEQDKPRNNNVPDLAQYIAAYLKRIRGG